MSQIDYDSLGISFAKFRASEDFFSQKENRLSLTLITGGKASIKINDKAAELIAPCIFLSSWNDEVALVESQRLTAKSLSFLPTIINKSLIPDNMSRMNEATDYDDAISHLHGIADMHDCNLIRPFLSACDSLPGMQTSTQSRVQHGPQPKQQLSSQSCVQSDISLATQPSNIINVLPQVFMRISEWFDQAGKAAKIKSSETWPYRVRRYLMQILFSLEDIKPTGANTLSDKSIADIALEHIHANYPNEISLDSLCKLVYVNRTSLARIFKAHTRRSPIDYLLHHRLSIACELLTHSKLSICKIAETTGFKYESYFTRQFKAKIGIAPTQYRQCDGFEVLSTNESRIVEEF